MAFPYAQFQIGSVSVDPPLVMAPLHEITDQPFRKMLRELGGLGLTVSEMVSCEALVRGAHKAERMMAADGGRPYAIQFAGCDPEHLAEAARMAEERGADMVDLNMGCPASNVTRSGSGSALLRDFKLAERCVQAMVKAVKIPVTVKVRSGWDERQKQRGDFMDFLRMFADLGVQGVALHPRTRSQQYTGHADWSCITRAVDAGFPFPIIGNGDVTTPEEARQMVQETGCQGVMIGRAALTNPWLFRQILEPDLVITESQRIDLCLRFFRLQLELFEPREALHKMKKMGSWFTKGIRGGVVFRQKLNQCHDTETLIRELEELRHRAE